MFPEVQNIKSIMGFVRTGKQKRAAIPNEVNPREQELSANIIDLDPFSVVDKNRVKEIIKEDEERE